MTCHIRKQGFRKLGSLSYAGAGTLRWDGLRRGLLRDAAAASPFSLNLPHEPAPFEAVVVAWVAAVELALVRVRVRVRLRLRLRVRLRVRLRLRPVGLGLGLGLGR